MANKFYDIFCPTPEEHKKQIEMFNRLTRENFERKGRDCSNCSHSVYVQQSPYYDYLSCEFDKSVELPGGLDHRHCCDKWNFKVYEVSGK